MTMENRTTNSREGSGLYRSSRDVISSSRLTTRSMNWNREEYGSNTTQMQIFRPRRQAEAAQLVARREMSWSA